MANLDLIHPILKKKVLQIIDAVAKRGYGIRVAQGLRSMVEQSRLYAQGRTIKGKRVTNAPAGFSPHNYGCAVDFQLTVAVNEKGVMTYFPDKSPVWSIIGEEAKKVGLEWGGSWKKFVDRPHVEIPVLKYGRPLLKLVHGNDLSKVWKEADRVFNGQTGSDSEDVLNQDKSKTFDYVVQSGNTLTAIAKKYLGDASRWIEIEKVNGFDKSGLPYTLAIGAKIKIPKR